MLAVFKIVQGIISKIMVSSGVTGNGDMVIPPSMVQTIENCDFWESIPFVGGNAHRQLACMGTLVHNDLDRIWAIF